MKENDVDKCVVFLKSRFNHRKMDSFLEEQRQLANLVKTTITDGKSTAAIVQGLPGSGKTWILQHALDKLKKAYSPDKYTIVKLNGYLYEKESQVLHHIVHQLNIDISRLGHNVPDKLFLVLQTLKKPVLFIIEEFDKFNADYNQAFMYELFDIIYEQKAPVCVVGTMKSDAMAALEKAVKSRSNVAKIIKLFGAERWSNRLAKFRFLLSIPIGEGGISNSFRAAWNENIEKLCSDGEATRVLKEQFDIGDGDKSFTDFLSLALSNVTVDCPLLLEAHLKNALNFTSFNVNLNTLSSLETCLLIAANHHKDIYSLPFNFEMIYNRYKKFAQNSPTIPCVSRSETMKSFESLAEMHLIKLVGVDNEHTMKEYALHDLLLTKKQIKEGVTNNRELPTPLTCWLDSSLV